MILNEIKRNVPPEYDNFKLEEMMGDTTIIDPIRGTLSNYLKNSALNEKNGVGLLFIGRMLGNGKTEAAYHILKEISKARVKWDRRDKQLTQGYTDFISILVCDYLKYCNRFENHFVELVQEAMTCPYLLLDELSADSFKRNLLQSQVDLFSLVDYRVSYNLPTLYTSNCESLEELKKLTGPKLFDRIAYKTTVINFSGPSVRPVITERLHDELDGRDPEALMRAEIEMLKQRGEH